MKDIVFYNTFSIGDYYFSKPFIQHICRINPERKFKLFTNVGTYFFQDIENLEQYYAEDRIYNNPAKLILKNFFEQHRNDLFFTDEQTIYVNTWVGVWNKLIEPLNCEISPEKLYIAFEKLVSKLNELLEDKLHFEPMNKRDFVYKLSSDLTIENFLKFRNIEKKECIFYFNRNGMTEQTKPFKTEMDQVIILNYLSQLYPNKYIIVPNIALTPKCHNIIPTLFFGVQENSTCKNVLEDIEIAGHCDYMIIFDIGAAYTFFNQNFEKYKANIYHFSSNTRCYTILKESIEYCLEASVEKYKYVQANDVNDLITQILHLIPQN